MGNNSFTAMESDALANVIVDKITKLFNKNTGSGSQAVKITDDLNKSLNKLKNSFDAMQKTTLKLFKVLGGEELNKTKNGFDVAQKAALKFFRVLGGIDTAKKFLTSYINNGLALSRLSQELGIHANELKAWQKAVGAAGMDAGAFDSTLKSLTSSTRRIAAGQDDAILTYLNELGISAVDAAGNAKDATQILLELADVFPQLTEAQAFTFGENLGIDPGTVSLLRQGRGEMENMVDAQRKFSADAAKDAEIAQQFHTWMEKLKSTMMSYANAIIRKVAPALEKLELGFKRISIWVKENADHIKAFFISLGIVATAMSAQMVLAATKMGLVWTVTAVKMAAAWLAAFWPVIVVLGMLFLFIDDFMSWKAGKDSVIGTLIELFEMLKESATDMFEKLKDDLSNMFKDTILGDIYELFKTLITLVNNAFGLIIDGFIYGIANMLDLIPDSLQVALGFDVIGLDPDALREKTGQRAASRLPKIFPGMWPDEKSEQVRWMSSEARLESTPTNGATWGSWVNNVGTITINSADRATLEAALQGNITAMPGGMGGR